MGNFAVIWMDLVSLLHCSGLLEACCWLDSSSSLVWVCPSCGSLCPTNCELTENALCFWWEMEDRLTMVTEELLCAVVTQWIVLVMTMVVRPSCSALPLPGPISPSRSAVLLSRTPALCLPWWPSALLALVCQCPRIGCSIPDVVSQVLNRGE